MNLSGKGKSPGTLRVALVGHVDHGKSTLIGRLLSDSGQTRDDRRAKVAAYCENVGRKFEFAFLLDALEEEQSQGITIDVTEVPWSHSGRDYLFVDTPGHREFLKKMVGGASRVDAAVLMLDVTEGVRESHVRQMRVLDLLGVKSRILVINKMDLVGWSEEAWRLRLAEVRERFPGDLTVIPAAAWHGANLLAPPAQMPWYRGPTLAEALERFDRSLSQGPARFFVQDVYRVEDKRIYVGRVESGSVKVGDTLTFHPGRLASRVTSLESYGETLTEAGAGSAIGLTLASALYLERGALGWGAGSDAGGECLTANRIVADVFWLDTEPLRAGEELTLKMGPRKSTARVARVHHEIDGDAVREKGSSIALFGRLTLEFSQPFSFDRFDDVEPTGRFVLCRQGQVVGGGRWVEADVAGSAQAGRVLWFTGLSGAGKSTLSETWAAELRSRGQKVFVLDGDRVRSGLCRDLGFSEEDRTENIRRAAEVAKLLAEEGFIVLTAFISPLAYHRELARSVIGAERFREVFVDCPLPVCESRDVKGLYGRARRGEIPNFTGVSAPFEPPLNPDVRIESGSAGVEECLRQLREFFPTEQVST